MGVYEENIFSTAFQSDGKIVAAGSIDTLTGMVARFNIDGTLDTTFGVNGIALPYSGELEVADPISIVVQPDDRIVIGGRSINVDPLGIEDRYLYMSRFNANGTPDTSFDGDGHVWAAFPNVIGTQGFKDIALQADGKIIGVGYRFNVPGNPTGDVAVIRFNTNGSIDTTFATNGYYVSNRNTVDDEAIGVVIQGDGKIVLVGRQDRDSLILRLNANGTLDTSFGTVGRTVTAVSSNDNFYDVALQADGKIVALSDADRNFGLARYQNTPTWPAPFVGGPYSVSEGGSVSLSGSGTDGNQAANALTYAWDLDGDGVYGETGADALHGNETGMNPTFQVGGLDGPSTWTIRLRVTNNGGDSNIATGSVAINNLAPSATLGNNGPVDEATSATVSFTNSFDYAADDTSAGFHYAFDYDNNGAWDLGDGTMRGAARRVSRTSPPPTSTTSPPHAPSRAGSSTRMAA